jgi:hypothetical protein
VPQGGREKRLAPPARDTAHGPHGGGSPIIRSTARGPATIGLELVDRYTGPCTMKNAFGDFVVVGDGI